MPKTIPKDVIKVKVNIQPGAVTLAQKQAWRYFWQKLIGEEKSEATK